MSQSKSVKQLWKAAEGIGIEAGCRKRSRHAAVAATWWRRSGSCKRRVVLLQFVSTIEVEKSNIRWVDDVGSDPEEVLAIIPLSWELIGCLLDDDKPPCSFFDAWTEQP